MIDFWLWFWKDSSSFFLVSEEKTIVRFLKDNEFKCFLLLIIFEFQWIIWKLKKAGIFFLSFSSFPSKTFLSISFLNLFYFQSAPAEGEAFPGVRQHHIAEVWFSCQTCQKRVTHIFWNTEGQRRGSLDYKSSSWE